MNRPTGNNELCFSLFLPRGRVVWKTASLEPAVNFLTKESLIRVILGRSTGCYM